jgi:uncharacterized membrane protein
MTCDRGVGAKATALLALAAWSGCSWFFVHVPDRTTADPQATARTCTDSSLVPSIDAAAGVLALAGAGGGEIVDHLTSHSIHDYELVLGLPLVVVGIVYLIAASHGNDAVEACRAASTNSLRDCDGCAPAVP